MKIKLLALFLAGLFFSCSNPFSRVSVLWTDVSEMASYVEQYNAAQNVYQILLEYKPQLLRELQTSASKPDLVVGRGLKDPALEGIFSHLGYFFDRGSLNRGLFYEDLLKMGLTQEGQILIPINFNLSVVTFPVSSSFKPSGPIFIHEDELRAQSLEFQKLPPRSLARKGFSPLWSPQFVMEYLYLRGADFRLLPNQTLAWNSENLNQGLQSLETWVTAISGNATDDLQFMNHYLLGYFNKLMDAGRILHYSLPLKEFLRIPELLRSSLDFRYFSIDDKIQVMEDVVFLGIPQGARQRNPVENFIEWFFRLENQKELIESSQNLRVRGFGIASGFSALISINESLLTERYPELVGKIPQAKYLQFPPAAPFQWEQIKTQVIFPWIQRTLQKLPPSILGEDFQLWLSGKGQKGN